MTTTQLQLRRDTTANIAAVTPAQGEPIYDVTVKTVTVGDGATAGGNYLAGPYQAGTWTPTLFGSTTAGSPTYAATPSGSYERIGRLVIARFAVTITAIGGIAGSVRIGGLPFTGGAGSDSGIGPAIVLAGCTMPANCAMGGTQVAPSATYAAIVIASTNGGAAQELPVSAISSAFQIQGTLIYHL
jgi:hypothetical protein